MTGDLLSSSALRPNIVIIVQNQELSRIEVINDLERCTMVSDGPSS